MPKAEPTIEEIKIVTPPKWSKPAKLAGRRFLIGFCWFFWVASVITHGVQIAAGQKPPWNHEFFFSILCGALIAVYVPRGRLFAFVGGFILSIPLLALIERLARALA